MGDLRKRLAHRLDPEAHRALHKWQQECESVCRENGRLRGALEMMLVTFRAHDRWCGYRADAPGDGVFNESVRRAEEVLASEVENYRARIDAFARADHPELS